MSYTYARVLQFEMTIMDDLFCLIYFFVNFVSFMIISMTVLVELSVLWNDVLTKDDIAMWWSVYGSEIYSVVI